MPHDVFISYVEEDRAQAIQTCDVLELAGIHCWIAPRDIAPGRSWGAAIIEAITQCRVMVLIFSSRTNLSSRLHASWSVPTASASALFPSALKMLLLQAILSFFWEASSGSMLSMAHLMRIWLGCREPSTRCSKQICSGNPSSGKRQ